MPTERLAVGTTQADSADFTVAANEEATVCLKDAAGPVTSGRVDVMLKDDAGQYFVVDSLSAQQPALVLTAGTWMFRRYDGASCGVFSA